MRARRMAGTARGRASTVARLTGYLLQAKHDPPRIGTALVERRRHCPVSAREGQFILDPLAFQQQALAGRSEKRLGETEQPVQRSKCPGGYDIDRLWRHCLDTAAAN